MSRTNTWRNADSRARLIEAVESEHPDLRKACTKCLKSLPLDAFGVHKECQFGRNSRCKACVRAHGRKHYTNNKEAVAEYGRKYRQENAVSRKLKKQEWYARTHGLSLEELRNKPQSPPRKVVTPRPKAMPRPDFQSVDLLEPEYRERFVERFWRKVGRSGPTQCWNWTGTLTHQGYGRILVLGRARLAHRISYELSYGAIPVGMFICHHCDNPACVNPEHLFVGTHLDNVRDMLAKGRNAHGERASNAKHTEHDVREMRQMRQEGSTYREIANHFNIGSPGTVYQIVSGQRWAHVK